MSDENVEYLRDESRTIGNADSISFPQTEQEISVKTESKKSDAFPE